ncbi:hypothetical protein cand_033570 [Cryptosporidium andersoni]|uniref:Uncharacterized protein n=1 Tax=Cryptosporidium andersoni TaxID=117008 RepID=A0A1J4MXP4_9CRYT|nr:hypothetical protein cand_033570 [Cryptosporidium andersoni]
MSLKRKRRNSGALRKAVRINPESSLFHNNIVDEWNGEIVRVTESIQETTNNRAHYIFNSIGRRLETEPYEFWENEDKYLDSILINSNVDDSIKILINNLSDLKSELEDSRNDTKSLDQLKKSLKKVVSRALNGRIVKDSNYIFHDWTIFIPVVLCSSLSNKEIFPILERFPNIIKYLIKSIRSFEIKAGIINKDDIETVTSYRQAISLYLLTQEQLKKLSNSPYRDISNNIKSTLDLAILRRIKEFNIYNESSNFFYALPTIPEGIESIKKAKEIIIDDSTLGNSEYVYIIYGRQISFNEVFGISYINNRLLENFKEWFLYFKENFRSLKLSNKELLDNRSTVKYLNSSKFEKFIGYLGYGYSSFDHLKSLNPNPEIMYIDLINSLRTFLAKKNLENLKNIENKESESNSNFKFDLCLPEFPQYNNKEISENPVSIFPTLPVKKCTKRDNVDKSKELTNQLNIKNYKSSVPLGFFSKMVDKFNREFEIIILDRSECSIYSKGKLSDFCEYGISWEIPKINNQYIRSPTNFRIFPIRSCTATVGFTRKYKAFLYYLRWFIENIIDFGWKRRLAIKNRKYEKLIRSKKGYYLTSSQRDAISRITKIIANSGLWESFNNITPNILTPSDMSIIDKQNYCNDDFQWEDIDVSPKNYYEVINSHLNSSQDFKKKLSSKCQKLLAKYILYTYPKFLIDYYKARRLWRQNNATENSTRNKLNVARSSKLQLDIIGHMGEKHLEAQLSDFNTTNSSKSKDKQIITVKTAQSEHLEMLEKKCKLSEFVEISLLPNFEEQFDNIFMFKLIDFLPNKILSSFNLTCPYSENSIYLCVFAKELATFLFNNKKLELKFKDLLWNIICYINWMIFLLPQNRKSFGGPKGVQKCLNQIIENLMSKDKKYQYHSQDISIQFCQWAIDTVMISQHSESNHHKYTIPPSGEGRLMTTIIWLANYVKSYSINSGINTKCEEEIPMYYPEPIPVEFSSMLKSDLQGKYDAKFRVWSYQVGFRPVDKSKKQSLKSNDFGNPFNSTNLILCENPIKKAPEIALPETMQDLEKIIKRR